MSRNILALDTATPAVTAGIVRRDDLDRPGRAGHRRRPGARRAADAQRAGRAGRCRADDGRSRRRRGGLRSRPVHRPAGRDGDRRRLWACAGHPGARRVQLGRHRGANHRRHPGGHRCPPARGLLGPLPRRGPHRRSGGQRPGRRRSRPGAGGGRLARARRAVRPAAMRAGLPDAGRPGGRGPTGPRNRRRWWRCICAGPTRNHWRRAHDRRTASPSPSAR